MHERGLRRLRCIFILSVYNDTNYEQTSSNFPKIKKNLAAKCHPREPTHACSRFQMKSNTISFIWKKKKQKMFVLIYCFSLFLASILSVHSFIFYACTIWFCLVIFTAPLAQPPFNLISSFF